MRVKTKGEEMEGGGEVEAGAKTSSYSISVRRRGKEKEESVISRKACEIRV